MVGTLLALATALRLATVLLGPWLRALRLSALGLRLRSLGLGLRARLEALRLLLPRRLEALGLLLPRGVEPLRLLPLRLLLPLRHRPLARRRGNELVPTLVVRRDLLRPRLS